MLFYFLAVCNLLSMALFTSCRLSITVFMILSLVAKPQHWMLALDNTIYFFAFEGSQLRQLFVF